MLFNLDFFSPAIEELCFDLFVHERFSQSYDKIDLQH